MSDHSLIFMVFSWLRITIDFIEQSSALHANDKPGSELRKHSAWRTANQYGKLCRPGD